MIKVCLMKILNYGARYSIENPIISYLPNLVVERGKAIRLLHTKMQNPYRTLAAEKLKRIINKSDKCNIQRKRHSYIVKQLKNKLVTGNAMFIRADKGRTVVIVTQKAYTDEV